jgi:hypothetical protein
MLKAKETKLIVENWRKFLHESKKDEVSSSVHIESDCIELSKISKKIFIDNNLVKLQDKGEFAKLEKEFFNLFFELIRDSRANRELKFRLENKRHVTAINNKVKSKERQARDNSERESLSLLSNSLHILLRQIHEDDDLSAYEKRQLANIQKEHPNVERSIIKKVYKLKQEKIYEYNLGYTNEDNWPDNFLRFLREVLQINLEEFKYFQQAFAQFIPELRQECQDLCMRNLGGTAFGAKEFILKVLEKAFRLENSHA